MNPTLATDGYKLDHRRQYPEQTVRVYSNMTPRKSRIPGIDSVLVFGPQYYCLSTLIEMWNKEFFNKKFKDVAEEFMETITAYLGEDAAKAIGTDHWKELHDLGYLPLKIKCLPEGSKCPIRTPFITITNTHHKFFWLTNYIETDLSAEIWPMCTSMTTADAYYRIFSKWAIKTVGTDEFVKFQGHDFSYRGMFGREAAKMSGSAHLASGFVGTDAIPAIGFLRKWYGADIKNELIGCSVAATEHAVMCVGTGFYIKKNNLQWEKYGDAELAVFERLIFEIYPKGIVSIVSDTWDLWKVILEYLLILKDRILARDGKLVIRPDSGDPVNIICGNMWDIAGTFLPARMPKPTEKGVVELLWDIFGGTESAQGFKVLDPHIGCIYGDSITLERAELICRRLAEKGFASTNWVAGIGSFTYQHVTRDTYGFAMKATYAEVAMKWFESMPPKPDLSSVEGIEVFKDPITDDGTKKSAKGLIQVTYNTFDKKYTMKDQATWEEEDASSLQTIFLNGKMIKTVTLSDVRKEARA